MRTLRLLHGLVLGLTLLASGVAAQGTEDDYARARRFLPAGRPRYVLNEQPAPRWIGETDRFWYRREVNATDEEFVRVDAAAGTRAPLFDHGRLAAALSTALDTTVTAASFPFDDFELSDDERTIEFGTSGEQQWRCSIVEYTCERLQGEGRTPGRSPDGRWVVFVREHDLYLRSTENGREVRLTSDGTPDHAWATRMPSPLLMIREDSEAPQQPPLVSWSPDSRRFVATRIDTRGAGTLSMVVHAPEDDIRPRHYTYHYPLPPDEVLPTAEFYAFDVGMRQPVRAALEPLTLQYYGGPMVDWSEDGREYYVTITERGYTAQRLHAVDPSTGTPRLLVEEREEPYVNVYANVDHRMIGDGRQILWASERDGWMHLYLYDAQTGRPVRQVTRGEWVVRDILHVDDESGTVFFTAGGREPGRDPYLQHLYRVGLDGRGLQLLTPEDAEHTISFSPTGRFFVDTRSRPDAAPVSTLRRAADGRVVFELERADIAGLEALGWQPPRPFAGKARDGVTDVYGIVWLPTTFDPARRYPVIEYIYTGPHSFFVPKAFAAWRNHAQSIAELGFVVVQVDGLGTARRSRAFHLKSWQNLGDGGIEDHIAALRQLADTAAWMDLTRVGIYGHSAGGYDAVHAMLTHPEFYKVGVSSAGNHDHRLDKAVWNTQWMGWPIGPHYDAQSNVTLAKNLQGRLLLAHGDIDENVPVSATLRLVDALIEADKDFDLIILPNQAHGFGNHPYFIRRRWDFFVRHLLNEAAVTDNSAGGRGGQK